MTSNKIRLDQNINKEKYIIYVMSTYFGLEKDNFTFLSKNNVGIWVKLF